MGLGLDPGGQDTIPINREHCSVRADVAVGDEVGIELTRDFTNSQKHKLCGQITEYMTEFPCVLVVACGISDLDGWRELQNEYDGGGGVMGMDQSEVHGIHKREENFGSGSSGGDDGGLLGGDWLF